MGFLVAQVRVLRKGVFSWCDPEMAAAQFDVAGRAAQPPDDMVELVADGYFFRFDFADVDHMLVASHDSCSLSGISRMALKSMANIPRLRRIVTVLSP